MVKGILFRSPSFYIESVCKMGHPNDQPYLLCFMPCVISNISGEYIFRKDHFRRSFFPLHFCSMRIAWGNFVGVFEQFFISFPHNYVIIEGKCGNFNGFLEEIWEKTDNSTCSHCCWNMTVICTICLICAVF